MVKEGVETLHFSWGLSRTSVISGYLKALLMVAGLSWCGWSRLRLVAE